MDTARYSIRNFEEADFNRENPLTAEAWRGIFEGYRAQLGDAFYETFYPNWQDRKYNEFGASMKRNAEAGRAVTIVDRDGRIAAMGSYTVRGSVGVVVSNAVHPELRGRGIGHAMYDELLRRMRAEGLRYAEVTTGGDEAHTGARRAYQAAGFGHPVPHVLYFRDNEKAVHGLPLPENTAIRPPRGEEYEAVCSLAVQAWEPIWRESERMLGDLFVPMRGDFRRAKYDSTMAALNNPGTCSYVLTENGRIAGFCTWRREGENAQVGLNGVGDAYHGRGYGFLMQQYITSDMLAHSIRYARVLTGGDPGHAPARHTYEKAGFSAFLPSVTYSMAL